MAKNIVAWYNEAYASQVLEDYRCIAQQMTPQQVEDELFRILDALPEKQEKKELKKVQKRVERRLKLSSE